MAESIGANSAFQHILENIFENLNIDDLISCQKVSPYWRKLLENPNFWLKNYKLEKTIYEIASSGNLEALQFLHPIFSKHSLLAKSNRYTDPSGNKAIHIACQEGHLEIVEFLTDSNQPSHWVLEQITLENRKDGASPFIYASFYGHAKIVKHLLQSFYKLVPRNRLKEYESKAFRANSAEHAFHYAIEKGHIEVVKVFMEYEFELSLTWKLNSDYIEGIDSAAVHGHLEIVKYLLPYWENDCLDAGEPFEELYERLLRRAASSGHLEIMKWLIPKVPNPFVFSTKLAQRYGCDELVDFVKTSGLVFYWP